MSYTVSLNEDDQLLDDRYRGLDSLYVELNRQAENDMIEYNLANPTPVCGLEKIPVENFNKCYEGFI